MADNDAAEDALLVAEETHDCACCEGDEGVGHGGAPWWRGEVEAGGDGEAGLSAQAAGVVVGLGAGMVGRGREEGEGGCAGDVGGRGGGLDVIVSSWGRDGLVLH